MGRKNGKLIPFLKESLMKRKYINLIQESDEIFSLELPRYEQSIDPAYEMILKVCEYFCILLLLEICFEY